MPQLGETVTEGTITKWHKQVGDAIEEDEVLFEVSTDKVDSEVPSPVTGTVTEILVPEGETVSVGTKLAVIGQPGQASGTGNGAAGATAANGAAQALDGVESAPPEAVEVPVGAAEVATEGASGESATSGAAPADRDATETAGGGRRPAGQSAPAPAKPPVGGTPRPGSRPGRPAASQCARPGRPEQAPLARRPSPDCRTRPGPGRDTRLRCWRQDHSRRRTGGDRATGLQRGRSRR